MILKKPTKIFFTTTFAVHIGFGAAVLDMPNFEEKKYEKKGQPKYFQVIEVDTGTLNVLKSI